MSRVLKAPCALPLRQRAFPAPLAKGLARTVTTDAASSHAEKEQVPEVGLASMVHRQPANIAGRLER